MGLIETDKDITLNEMVARRADERDVRIGRSALNNWLRGCGFTYKKDRARIGAGAAGGLEKAPSLV